MKRIISTILWMLSIIAWAYAQVDYLPMPELISSENIIQKITWIKSAPGKISEKFDHLVVFLNVDNDQINGSKVDIQLFHNRKMINSFLFNVGDGIYNRIYLSEAVNLKKGDSLWFLFQLHPIEANETYVFNIYKERINHRNNDLQIAGKKTEQKAVVKPSVILTTT